ncbi:MAG TPA: SPFH domain-containing protein, partial [Allosphingosinicella sp.]|nr:SPFH domain-containing protein [Allosphingosinicella sp.]
MSTNADSAVSALSHTRERRASTQSGYAMLLLLLLLLVAGFFDLGWLVNAADPGLPILMLVVLVVGFVFTLCGFYLLQPNQAAAILLFGDYRGTDRRNGLRWRLPWLTRSKISTRIHNITSE